MKIYKKDNPFIQGYWIGECKMPDIWRTERWKRKPNNYGRIVKTNLKKE